MKKELIFPRSEASGVDSSSIEEKTTRGAIGNQLGEASGGLSGFEGTSEEGDEPPSRPFIHCA